MGAGKGARNVVYISWRTRGVVAALLLLALGALLAGCGGGAPQTTNLPLTRGSSDTPQTINLTLIPGSPDTPSTVKGSLGSESIALKVAYPEDVLSGTIGKASAAIRWPANSTPQSVSGTVGDLPTRVTLVETNDGPPTNRITGTIGPDVLNARSAIAVSDSGSSWVGLVVKGTLGKEAFSISIIPDSTIHTIRVRGRLGVGGSIAATLTRGTDTWTCSGTLAADPAMTYALLVTCALGTYALDVL